MKGFPFVLAFTALTFLAWGAYGPTLHHGSLALKHDSLRAFVGVGLAYFLIAVLIPLAIIRIYGESGKWTFGGMLFSIVAGVVGAIGALGVILALGFGGKTVFVMPVVFGIAPVVNTLVSATIGGTFRQVRPIFLFGIATVAIGAAGVMIFRAPAGSHAKSVAAGPEASVVQSEPSEGAKTETTESHSPNPPSANFWNVLGSILIAALCWGSYGPLLHLGQAKMSGSRLRPFICVGIAYFLIAVIAPLMLIYRRVEDTGVWTTAGLSWSILAGIAGALGALGVILAFNAGGKPSYVMPLIFGFAPVVNTFISLSQTGEWDQVQSLFWISLGVVITGAVAVLLTAPKSSPHVASPPREST